MIDTVDFLPYKIAGVGSGGVCYGIIHTGSDSALYKLSSLSHEPATPVFNFAGYTVHNIYEHPDNPEMLFARAGPFIFKSVDGGVSWGNNSPTYNNGDVSLHVGNVGAGGFATSTLQKGVCIFGSTVLVAEYNVVSPRTPGGINDAARILRSDDYGDTWVIAAQWNTNGSRQIRHFHGAQYNNGYVYITAGDTDSESGILRWDPTQPLASNQPLSAYENCWHGAQRYRTGDILFPPGDYMYWMADTHAMSANAGEVGIWRGRKDMTGTPERVDSQIINYYAHAGWYGAEIDGTMVFSSFLEAEASGGYIVFFASRNRADWDVVGRYYVQAGIKGGTDNMYAVGNRIVFFKSGGSGKSKSASIVIAPAARSKWPRVLHPTYWVGNGGVNVETAGERPSLPFGTLEYALTSGKVADGGRVFVDAGPHTATQLVSRATERSGSEDKVLISGSSKAPSTLTGSAFAYLLDNVSSPIAADAANTIGPAVII